MTSTDSTPLARTEPPQPSGIPRLGLVPFHPLLLAAFPVLSLFAANTSQVQVHEIWRPMALNCGGAAIVFTLVAAATRSIRKAALVTSALVLVYGSYGHLSNVLPMSMRPALGPACIVLVAGALFLILRNRGTLYQTTAAVNIAAIVLIAPSSWAVASALMRHDTRVSGGDARPSNAGLKTTRKVKTIAAAEADELPDIYYVILDAYGRADSLNTFYGYDNTPFVRALQDRGFYVASRSRANYDQTGLCLSSSLNMNYLDALMTGRPGDANIQERLRRLVDDNAVANYLSGLGYHYVCVLTGAGQTQFQTADLRLVFDPGPPPAGFEANLQGLSALKAARRTRVADYERHRNFILAGFANLKNAWKLPYPKFVFTHIYAPHPPFVFGHHGEPIDPPYPMNDADASWLLGMITRDQYRAGYIGQLQYINSRVLEAIDTILNQSRNRPIIIVQGDHGSRMNLDWNSQDGTDLREPFSILNAYLVPKGVRAHLYDGITPVNSFRILLSHQFGAKLPPLPDHSYYSTATDPLRFSDVTKLLPRNVKGDLRIAPRRNSGLATQPESLPRTGAGAY